MKGAHALCHGIHPNYKLKVSKYTLIAKKKTKNKQKKRTLKEKKKENLGKQTNKKQTETVLPGFLT